MRYMILCALSLCCSLAASAQDSFSLQQYEVGYKLNEECTSGVSLTLFEQVNKQDTLNQLVVRELLKGFNNERFVTLKSLYENKTFGPEKPYMFSVTGMCAYHKGGIYSFVACPFNACDHAPRSNYEATCVTLDVRTKKILTLDDLIDPAKKDSFEKYVYFMATRYHIRNVPTCFVSQYQPVNVKASSGLTTRTDSVEYMHGITNKFYLYDGKLCVFNNAAHRDYGYRSVEVTLQLYYLQYFLRPEMVERLVI